jgi:hypothetical protein
VFVSVQAELQWQYQKVGEVLCSGLMLQGDWPAESERKYHEQASRDMLQKVMKLMKVPVAMVQ